MVDGRPRIISDPPLLVPVDELLPADTDRTTFESQINGLIGKYRRTLETDRRFLLEQFEFCRHGPQGGRRRQRRHPLLDRPAARP